MRVSKKMTLSIGVLLCISILLYWFFVIKPRGGELCIQVVTDAKHPITGQIKTFASPCEVPIGWQTIDPKLIEFR